MSEIGKMVIEKFTFQRYNKYKKTGTSMRIVTSKGQSVDVIAENAEHDVVCVINEYGSIGMLKSKVRAGDVALYIVTGVCIEPGDIYLEYSGPSEDQFFFYRMFEGVREIDGRVGMCFKWNIDCQGKQFCGGGLFTDVKSCEGKYVKVASAEDIERYDSLLLKIGYERDDDGLRYCPLVGVDYWTIETVKGIAVPMKWKGVDDEGLRPFGHKLCFRTEGEASLKADKINEFLNRL